MKLRATYFIFIFAAFLASSNLFATSNVRNQMSLACRCFLRTELNQHWTYFGASFGAGQNNDEAYEDAKYHCEHRAQPQIFGRVLESIVDRCQVTSR